MVVSDYYKSLDYEKEKKKFRDKVLELTGMSIASFYNKLRAESWRPSEIYVINTIINQ